ncbi:MAG TPA: DHH family phosphoesterase [Nitrososphaerales archaeon]|nr:DHH family phosphoesterase [Nitrososphaerales archaeon]
MEVIPDSGQGRLLIAKNLVRTRNALIFTHRQADPDALCAAFAISEYLNGISEKDVSGPPQSIKIVAPQGANLLGNSVCQKLGFSFTETVSEENVSNADLIIAVDVGEPELLEPYLGSIVMNQGQKILIDHHGSNANSNASTWKGFQLIVDEKATSTCEIVTRELPLENLSEKVAPALLTGLMFDSQHLGLATESTLLATLKLVRAGARIEHAKEVLRSRAERSEVIARIKSAQRLRFEQIGKYFLLQSEVSSFQAAVARMLVDIGGDVGMAYGDHEREARVSLRSTQLFFRETKIDLGQLVSREAQGLGIIGGGHSTAASISGKTNLSNLVSSIIAKVKQLIPQ